MNFAIGLVITVGCILGGYAALGGHLEVLFQPYEFVIIAGSSLGICGVIGGIFAFVWIHRSEQPRFSVVLAIVGLCAAVVLSFCLNFHGPPILAGALLAGLECFIGLKSASTFKRVNSSTT